MLNEVAISGSADRLRGLKENVIMGRLVPAGTGMEYYRQVKIAGEDVVEETPTAPGTTGRGGRYTPATSRKAPAKNRWPSKREAIPAAGGPARFAVGFCYFRKEGLLWPRGHW